MLQLLPFLILQLMLPFKVLTVLMTQSWHPIRERDEERQN
ncbi:hypothetical protein SLEP1_g22478 [Rubroshorea leprosula]|uniref:ATP synthase F0 subunit 8 n=1 Tax=Rubroshorea leprosula TaxID=152421 RepID=A0AAV5JI51_9ROSI|nr:hypothetical protein SLEP1_g22478 [Rubroshorea leprosula]